MLEITAIAKAIESVCNFLCTAEGQALCKQWRDDTAAFRSNIEKAAKWLEAQSK